MKKFYKYYYVFFITFIVSSIFLGGYRASVDISKEANDNKVMVKAEEPVRKEVEKPNNEVIETPVKNENNSAKASNEAKNIDKNHSDFQSEVQKKNVITSFEPSEEEAVAVFKVSKDQIVNQYSSLEKLELLSIIKMKLNETHYKTIESLIYSGKDDFYVLKKVNSILKANLNVKDYEKILKLASRVINTDLVNNK
ncbi:MAG: hypothetical protein AB6733_01690 [Clostridiaceae bacterium]